MGMASSQVRFLQLTSRKHSIGLQLEHLSLERMSLTRDMQKLSLNYNQALSSKVMKWTNNSGATYTDMSYSTFMRPNAANGYNPVLLTDSSDRVVLDSKYKKYAEMISANGAAGGTWNGSDGEPRTSILAALTGFDAEKINNLTATQNNVKSASTARTTAYNNLQKWLDKEPVKFVPADRFASKLGKYGEYDLSSLYYSGSIHITSPDQLKPLMDHIKDSLSQYFADAKDTMNIEDKTKFQEACDATESAIKSLLTDFSDKGEERRKSSGITGETNNWDIEFASLFNAIMLTFAEKGGSARNGSGDDMYYAMRDTTSGSSWDVWYQKYEALNTEYEDSETSYSKACEENNEVFTSEEETQIAFYDKLFEAIVEKGWVEDYYLSDNDYLNQKLQNNDYYFTTITKNSDYNEDLPTSPDNYKYDYDSHIASDFENIVMVNEQKTRDDALADYEYKKSIISSKEKRLDIREKNLQTEESSIIKMMESIKKVAEDNSDTYFKIFA
jgi:hypothetical protein